MNLEVSSSKFTYSIKTMGCKANIYDSLVIEKELQDLGGTPNTESPDVFILNSCTVTEQADKQCLREVAQVKKKSPNTWTLVTGCYAQVGAEKLKTNSNIDTVLKNETKSYLSSQVAERFSIPFEKQERDPELFWGQLPTMRGKTRAFLKIQEGCNDFCTYCIIPYARGKSRSVRMGQVLAEAERLTQQGVREIVLTGTNIGDYGMDLESSLEDLIDAILKHTSVQRLRLTSLDPTEITDRLLGMMGKGSKLMPHFHVSLQSPVSKVLRAMKRDYRREEVVIALEKIHQKSSDIFVGMDVISGFPTEQDSDHLEAIDTLKQLPWTRLHVFPYSEREGTPATRIAQSVPVSIRKERARELMELSNIRHERFVRTFIDQQMDCILFESLHEAGGDYFVLGHAENYMRVMARVPTRSEADAKKLLNTLSSARLLGVTPKPTQDWTIEGVITSSNI